MSVVNWMIVQDGPLQDHLEQSKTHLKGSHIEQSKTHLKKSHIEQSKTHLYFFVNFAYLCNFIHFLQTNQVSFEPK